MARLAPISQVSMIIFLWLLLCVSSSTEDKEIAIWFGPTPIWYGLTSTVVTNCIFQALFPDKVSFTGSGQKHLSGSTIRPTTLVSSSLYRLQGRVLLPLPLLRVSKYPSAVAPSLRSLSSHGFSSVSGSLLLSWGHSHWIEANLIQYGFISKSLSNYIRKPLCSIKSYLQVLVQGSGHIFWSPPFRLQ